MKESINLIITKTDGEYRVPGPDGREETAYYTDDRKDAIGTAVVMYKSRDINIRFRTID